MNTETNSTDLAPGVGPEHRSRVGLRYVEGPADRPYRPGDHAFNVHQVVSDEAAVPGCATVENAAGQRFPVTASLVDRIAGPATR